MALEIKPRADMEKLLDVGKVDVGNGTLFGVSELRKPRKEGLTLIISTGGSGMSSIKEAMRIADQKLELDYKNYVKFIVVDSSRGEIAAVKKSGVTTLNISSPGAQARMEHSVRPTFFKRFMPKDYDISLINDDGASQDRTTGKMKLYDTQDGSTNDTLFRKLIQDLFKGAWAGYKNLPVDIMILSGLSGGNGSGTFVDLAVQAKAACPDASKVRVYGYLMLPDTAERFADSDSAKRSLYRNAFAALKELESYMSISFNGKRKEVIPSTLKANEVTLSAINLPYDYPVLISGDYDDAVSMIAETIVNLVADSNGAFDQRAFYSNILTYRDIALSAAEMSDSGILKQNACPEDSHMYCGIGYAHASIPEKIVIPNIVSKVCDKLYVPEQTAGIGDASTETAFCSKTKHIGKIDFEKQIRILFGLDTKAQLTPNSLWKKVEDLLESCCILGENDWDVTLKDIQNGEVGEYLRGFNVENTKVESIDRMLAELKKLYEAFCTGAESVMKVYGPRGLQHLYEGEGDADATGKKEDFSAISIKSMMQSVVDGLNKVAGTPGKYPETGEKVGMWQHIKGAVGLNNKLDEWKGEAKKAAQQDVCSKVAAAMGGVSGGWKTEFSDKVVNFEKCSERFADVLETLTDYYSGVGKSLDSDDFQEFSKSTGERNGVNLCSDASMYKWVKDRVETKVNGIKIANVKEALIEDFMAHSDIWISDDPGKARRQYDLIMSQCCAIGKYASANNGLNLTITDYFEELLKDVPEESQAVAVNNVVGSIMGRLLQSSAPSLEMAPRSYCHINQIILVPRSLIVGKYGPLIEEAFKSYLGQEGRVAISSVVESIVCYQASVANPLSGLKDLSLWESGYEDAATTTMHLCNGEHVTQYNELTKKQTDVEMNVVSTEPISAEDDMLGGTGLSWRNYPSINVLRYQGNFHSDENTSESKYRRDIFNRKIDYALKEGIIECERDGNIYKYYVNLIPQDWGNLSVRGYRQKEAGRFKRGKALFEYLSNQNPHSEQQWRYQAVLTGSPFFGEAGFDFSEIIRLEHWTQERINRTHDSYMRRILRKNTYLYQQLEYTLYRYYEVRRALEEIESVYAATYQAQTFAELFAYGVVNADEDEYEWTVRINTRGGNIEIMTFGRKTTAKMGGFEKGLLGDGLKLAIVYNRFRELLDRQEIKMDELTELKNDLIDTMTDKELDQMIDARVGILQKSLESYTSLYGRAKDPIDAMLEAYKLDDDMIDPAEQVQKFYEAVQEAINTI
ncbi:MAG: tubulin-like doman-containing protein [Lachnospiraceae bacterium]|nr:tubulin-like doman-containing protein [Lachnospiraceae bacterium]